MIARIWLPGYGWPDVEPDRTLIAHAFEVPNTRGLQLHNFLTVSLSGSGGIDNLVNNTGGAVSAAHRGPNDVVSYP